jgi:eukaryotic-like serine/threonine-protein kinase
MLLGMTSGPPPNNGRLLDGRYRLGSLLGVGGVAEVYRALDERLHRGVAVKLFRGDVAEQLHRHEDEMRTLARLNHPSLVTVFDAGTDELTQQPYLVMALVEGATLADQLRAGAIAPERTAEIGAAVADALAYVHGQGLVHRDIKPANVLISNAGRVFLADFGIARLVDSAHLTQAGDVLGTPSFFAPEQVTGEPVGPPVDVYALGLVLLECLTGRREYDGTSLEVAMARLSRQPEIPPGLPGGWRDVLVGMTAREPSSRLSAAQVADRLRRIAAGDDRTAALAMPPTEATTMVTAMPTTVMAPPPTTALPPPVGTAPPRRRRGAWVAVGVLALLIVAAVAVAAVVADRHNNTTGGAHCPSGVPVLPGQLQTDMHTLDNLVCRASSSDVSPKAAKTLKSNLETVRLAASGTSRHAVRAAVQALDSEVQTLEGDNEISTPRAKAIQDQSGLLQTDFDRLHKPPTPPPTTASPTTPTPTPTPTPSPTVTVTSTTTLPPVLSTSPTTATSPPASP